MLKNSHELFKVRSYYNATVYSRNYHNDCSHYARIAHSRCFRLCIFAIVAQLIMIFGFQLPPGSAPVAVIILAIGIAGGTLQATGGIDYLVYLASKIIERFPKSLFLLHR